MLATQEFLLLECELGIIVPLTMFGHKLLSTRNISLHGNIFLIVAFILITSYFSETIEQICCPMGVNLTWKVCTFVYLFLRNQITRNARISVYLKYGNWDINNWMREVNKNKIGSEVYGKLLVNECYSNHMIKKNRYYQEPTSNESVKARSQQFGRKVNDAVSL